MGKLVYPRAGDLSPQRLAALLSCIPDDSWDEPDLSLALDLEGIAHTRFLRIALGLPPVADEPRTGDLVVATILDGSVIGRVYARPQREGKRHQIWLWRRFPPGTVEEAVKISASEIRMKKGPAGVILRTNGEREAASIGRAQRPIQALPSVRELRERRAHLEAQVNITLRRLDAQIEAAVALEAAEAAQVEAEAAARRARERALALAGGAATP